MQFTQHKIDLKHSALFLRNDGVLEVLCSDHDYTENDIKEITLEIGKLTNGKKILLLVIGSRYSHFDSDARNYMATPESIQFSIAEAYVIQTLPQRLLLNFYIKVNKPAVPTRFFTEKNDAEKWLKRIQIKA